MKKIIAMVLIFATSSLFAMSLSGVNKASKSELMAINGIGEVKAKAIMKARPFKSFDALAGVTGVGPQLVANIKGDVKSAANVKKVKKSAKKKTTSKTKLTKKDSKVKADKKTKTKSKETKKRKIKSMDEKKKELETKAKKTKTKKTKAKKTKSKKKN